MAMDGMGMVWPGLSACACVRALAALRVRKVHTLFREGRGLL